MKPAQISENKRESGDRANTEDKDNGERRRSESGTKNLHPVFRIFRPLAWNSSVFSEDFGHLPKSRRSTGSLGFVGIREPAFSLPLVKRLSENVWAELWLVASLGLLVDAVTFVPMLVVATLVLSTGFHLFTG